MSTLTKKKISFKEREERIIRRAIKSVARSQRQLEANEWVEVTRVYPDGRREKMKLRGHDILARSQPEPLSGHDVRKYREAMNMTQEQFARWLMVSIATVRNWEQKTGLPRGPALRLLHEYDKIRKTPNQDHFSSR